MKQGIFGLAMAVAVLLAAPAQAQNTTAVGDPAAETSPGTAASGPSQRIQQLRNEMDRMFNRFFHDNGAPGFNMGLGDNPAVDIVDRGDSFVVTADVPGADVSSLNVSVSGSTLIIRGSEPTEKGGDKYLRHETIGGAFERDITLPVTADLSKAEATYKDGVLTVTAPKNAAAANARVLPIRKLD